MFTQASAAERSPVTCPNPPPTVESVRFQARSVECDRPGAGPRDASSRFPRLARKRAVCGSLLGAVVALLAACDGTLSGIGPVPREPETPLPAAPSASAGADPSSPEQGEGRSASVAEPVPNEIGAQHLLVSYSNARESASSVHRSRDEARERAREALERIRAGAEFDTVVIAYTDEPGGAARRGQLGRFTRNKMVKAFADAAFRLKVGEVSTVVETPFGFHVIRRTE